VRQNELTLSQGARHKPKRIGRGFGSGHGRYSCKGLKGQKSRAGFHLRPGFEGGQNPFTKRLPELRGFTNIFMKEYVTVNIGRLDCFESNCEVTPQILLERGLIKTTKLPLKVLGHGSLEKPLVIKANKFTRSAKAKIEASGGHVEEIE